MRASSASTLSSNRPCCLSTWSKDQAIEKTPTRRRPKSTHVTIVIREALHSRSVELCVLTLSETAGPLQARARHTRDALKALRQE